MKHISVTIGIPVYQVEDVVKNSLMSALSQSYNNIEYIIVDDCGSDRSMDIVRKIVEKSTRKGNVRIVCHDCNRGLGEARNTIIKNSHSDYIYFMDSDDTIEPKTVDFLVSKAIDDNSPDIIVANYVTEYTDGKKEIGTTVKQDIAIESNEAILSYYSKDSIRISSWNKLYKRDFLIRNNIRYVNRYHEDYYFSLQELHYAEKILIVPDVLYHYILRSNSITGGLLITPTTVDRLLLVLASINDFILKHNVHNILYSKRYVDFLSYIAYSAYATKHDKCKEIIKNTLIYGIQKDKVETLALCRLGKIFYSSRILPESIRLIFLRAVFRVFLLKRKN